MTKQRTLRTAIMLSALLFPGVSGACSGDVRLFMEKRPVGSEGAFTLVEESRLDTTTGIITVCGRDRSWHGGFEAVGEGFSTTIGRRERTFAPAGNGTFLSNAYEAEHQGVRSQYRFRAQKP